MAAFFSLVMSQECSNIDDDSRSPQSVNMFSPGGDIEVMAGMVGADNQLR